MEAPAAHVLAAPPPREAHTHRRGTVTGVRVVLDFPQSLVEAFSLVWFPIFVFIFFIKEEIFRAQEGAGEKQSRGEPGAEAAGQKPREGSEAALTSRGCRRRRWGTCSVGVSQRRPRCHRSERKPKAGGGQRQWLEHVLCEARQPRLAASASGTRTRLEASTARKHPDGDLVTHKSPTAASGPGGISRRVTEGIRHGRSMARAWREVISPPPGSTPRETRALCYSPEIHRTSRLGGGRPREAPSSPGWGAIAPTGRPEGPSWLETGRRKSPAASRTCGPPRLLPTRGSSAHLSAPRGLGCGQSRRREPRGA